MDYNKTIVTGRLTRDPELKFTPAGKAVVNFSLAVNRNKEQVSYIPCVAWEKTAELVNQYCKKGNEMLVDGRLDQRSWEDADGKKRSVLEVTVYQVKFLSKPESVPDRPDLSDEDLF